MKAAVLTLAALVGVFGSAFGSVWFLDGRYAPLAAVEDMVWSQLKGDIRELRKDIKEDPNDENLKEDLQELIDRLCRSYPDDRECKA